ncbi:hypothetical protein FGG08_004848 [Glutinoglossum americanum]|uniref:Uncharacterized protein n=1 Tax=Glutinoglossum americanum TaxID=1670608 RepID=A0A9P8KWL7_9PEZI|nr:hypothetical protein FGG08_004848 [Glutinoglossum americanum]
MLSVSLNVIAVLGITLDPSAFAGPQTTSPSGSPSTTATPTLTPTPNLLAATATPTKQPLATGASIGIGIGAAIAGMFILAGLAFVGWKILKRRRSAEDSEKRPVEAPGNQRWGGQHVGELPAGYEGVEAGGRGYGEGMYGR